MPSKLLLFSILALQGTTSSACEPLKSFAPEKVIQTVDAPYDESCVKYRQAMVAANDGDLQKTLVLMSESFGAGNLDAGRFMVEAYATGVHGFKKDAAQYEQWAETLAPLDEKTAIDLSKHYSASGKQEDAIRVLETNVDTSAKKSLMLGRLLNQNGQYERAAKHLSVALSMGEQSAGPILVSLSFSGLAPSITKADACKIVEASPLLMPASALLSYAHEQALIDTPGSRAKRFAAAVLARRFGSDEAEEIILDTQQNIPAEGVPLLVEINSSNEFAQNILRKY